MRRLLVAVVVLVGLAVAADRLLAYGAERLVAERIRTDQSLASRPDVDIHGFPFLTQVAAGRYDHVDLTVRGLHRGPLDVSRVVAHLSGVQLAFGSIVRQQVDRIPIAHATAEVDIDYDAVDRLLADQHLRVSGGAAGHVHVTATAGPVDVDADVPLTIAGTDVVLGLPAGASVRIPLPDLPFGIRLASARAEPGGIVVRCSADGLVVPT